MEVLGSATSRNDVLVIFKEQEEQKTVWMGSKTKVSLGKGKRSVLLLNPVDNLTFSRLELATLRPFYYVTISTHCTTPKACCA
jgi:hypothetical protein